MTCDLHIHSTHSDGSLTPRQIVDQAKMLGLTVALTDHNTTAGLPEFMQYAHQQGVTAVAGVELSTIYNEQELHLLGLFLPMESFDAIEKLTQNYRILKEQSNRELVQRLCTAGYAIAYPEGENINRVHIAAQLLKKGYVPSIAQAFDTLLHPQNEFYTPPERLSFFDAIAFVRNCHALPVLAHPLKELDLDTLHTLLPAAKQAGLVGMEVIHSSYDSTKRSLAQHLAQIYGLLPSGGSDFHGENKPHIPLGSYTIPDFYYQSLSLAHRNL